MLNTTIQQFSPLLFVNVSQHCHFLLGCDEIVDDEQAWYGSRFGNLCWCYLYVFTFLQLVAFELGEEEDNYSRWVVALGEFYVGTICLIHSSFLIILTLITTYFHQSYSVENVLELYMAVINTWEYGKLLERPTMFSAVINKYILINFIPISKMRNYHASRWCIIKID